tara:strand:+ start:3290 stop:4108 length:819 start_codon:yes stop_codon:yes gene_type:complete
MHLIAQVLTLSIIALLGTSKLEASERLKQFDQNQYSPSKYGLKDLTFEVKIDGMEKDLKERYALTKVNDPRFKVYWLNPGRIEIEVLGLPPGFTNLKNELKKLVVERIEYVVPQNLSTRLRGYRFDEKKIKNDLVVLEGKDETNTKAINKIDVVLNEQGEIQSMKTTSPSGSQMVKFESSKKSWSHSKNVIDTVNISAVTGIQRNTTETKITYISKDGFGFPSSIATETTIEAMTNTEAKNKVTTSANLYFSNYEVNTGNAQKFLIGIDENN